MSWSKAYPDSLLDKEARVFKIPQNNIIDSITEGGPVVVLTSPLSRSSNISW
eukprot:c41222_g1_i1 orf=86-241(+)